MPVSNYNTVIVADQTGADVSPPTTDWGFARLHHRREALDPEFFAKQASAATQTKGRY
jgi:hypothetical protein